MEEVGPPAFKTAQPLKITRGVAARVRWFLCTGFLFVIMCHQALAAVEWAETATGASSTGDRKSKMAKPWFCYWQGKELSLQALYRCETLCSRSKGNADGRLILLSRLPQQNFIPSQLPQQGPESLEHCKHTEPSCREADPC